VTHPICTELDVNRIIFQSSVTPARKTECQVIENRDVKNNLQRAVYRYEEKNHEKYSTCTVHQHYTCGLESTGKTKQTMQGLNSPTEKLNFYNSVRTVHLEVDVLF